MAFSRRKNLFLATAFVLLILPLGLFLKSSSAPKVLPLSFIAFTNALGQTSALFRSEMPPAPYFLNFQSWTYENLQMRIKHPNGSVSTNTLTLKPADLQTFASGSNVTVQLQVAMPTNASAFMVTYISELEEGLSLSSVNLTLPIRKRFSYRSEYIPVVPPASNTVVFSEP